LILQGNSPTSGFADPTAKRWAFNGSRGLAMLQIRVLEYLQSFELSELIFNQALTTRRLD
jgi:hypothetical protein